MLTRLSRLELSLIALFALVAGGTCALGLFGIATLFVLVLGVIGLWLIFERPEIALEACFFLLFIAQIKFRSRDATAALSGNIDSQIAFELAIYGLVGLISLVNFIQILTERLRPSRNESLLLCYVALAGLSAFWSTAPKITIVRTVELAILYLFTFSAVRRLGPRGTVMTIGKTLVLSVVFFAGMAVIFPFANGTRISQQLAEFSLDRSARFTWFAVQPITAGAEAAGGIAFLTCWAMYAGGWRQRLAAIPLWVYTLALFAVLLATRARGPLIAAMVAGFALLLRRYTQMRIVSWAVLMALLVIVLGAINVGTNFMTAAYDVTNNANPVIQFLMRGQSAGEFLSLTGRSDLWSAEASLFLGSPIIGYGYIASRGMLLAVMPWAGEAHNALGETLLDLGLLGFLTLWIPLIWTLFESISRADPRNRNWTEAAIMAFIVFAVIDGISETGMTGAVSFMPILLFGAMFAHRDPPARVTRPMPLRAAPAAPPYGAARQPDYAFARHNGYLH